MSPASLAGTTLGKYRVLEPLGRGGMAQVYKAHHPQLDRYVAIKILRSDLVEDEEFLARFQREARAVAALRHPNIVHVYDFDTQGDTSYMVLELLEGDTLKSALNSYRVRGEKMPLGETTRILLDVLAGLGYAHSQGIIHRDLKPANVMLTRTGQAVLTDFGIAQIIGATRYTISGALMGTINYMAPEQGKDGTCDIRSDMYALGIVLFEMLTGRVPFDADTPLAILMKHLNDPLPMPRQFDESIPDEYERVVLKALAKDPSDRYQSAAEMAQALQQAAAAAGIEIPPSVTPFVSASADPLQKSVLVFSGSARQHITDNDFAKDDTDSALGQKLAGAPASGSPEPGLAVPGWLKRLFKVPDSITEDEITPKRVTDAVVYSVIALAIANVCGLWVSGLTSWQFFSYAWPLELGMVALLLSALMASLANPWLFIPGGIVLGAAYLLAYSTLTGWWQHWLLFWPLVIVLIAVPIVSAIQLHRMGRPGRWISRKLGTMMVYAAMALFVISIIVGALRVM